MLLLFEKSVRIFSDFIQFRQYLGLVDVRFGCYNERFGGCGSIINAHSDYVEIDPSLEIVLLENYRKPCIELLRRFYLQQNERAPMPKKKGSRTFKEYIENSME